MVVGIFLKLKNIFVYVVVEKNFFFLDFWKYLVVFYVLIGCDIIFFFYGILKKLVFKVYRDNYEFFEGLGEGDLID